MSKRKLLWAVPLTVALFTTVLAVASMRKPLGPKPKAPPVSSRQNPIVTPTATDQTYVRAAQVWPQLRWHLKTLGDRIEKPGKERINITGTIKRAGDSQALPMTLTVEFPDRVRLTVQDGLQQRVVTFNGQAAASVGNALSARERDFIETLVYDTADGAVQPAAAHPDARDGDALSGAALSGGRRHYAKLHWPLLRPL